MKQLTLSFEPGISQKHRSLLDCCATGVYRNGLTKVAGKIDIAASNLSTALSGGDRKFGVDHLEHYISEFGDLTPVYYLVERFLKGHENLQQDQLLAEADTLMSEFRAVVNRLEESSS